MTAGTPTPGPWNLGSLDRNGQRTVNGGPILVAVVAHECIASREPEMEANARLIAAAPRMYDFVWAFIDGRATLAEADEIRRRVEG